VVRRPTVGELLFGRHEQLVVGDEGFTHKVSSRTITVRPVGRHQERWLWNGLDSAT